MKQGGGGKAKGAARHVIAGMVGRRPVAEGGALKASWREVALRVAWLYVGR